MHRLRLLSGGAHSGSAATVSTKEQRCSPLDRACFPAPGRPLRHLEAFWKCLTAAPGLKIGPNRWQFQSKGSVRALRNRSVDRKLRSDPDA